MVSPNLPLIAFQFSVSHQTAASHCICVLYNLLCAVFCLNLEHSAHLRRIFVSLEIDLTAVVHNGRLVYFFYAHVYSAALPVFHFFHKLTFKWWSHHSRKLWNEISQTAIDSLLPMLCVNSCIFLLMRLNIYFSWNFLVCTLCIFVAFSACCRLCCCLKCASTFQQHTFSSPLSHFFINIIKRTISIHCSPAWKFPSNCVSMLGCRTNRFLVCLLAIKYRLGFSFMP